MADLQFVVHEHHASRLHYDFRLELDGVLKSWAIPKGPSMNPHDKRLAVMVSDHTIEYASFEGIIPPENYGAGAVIIWDRGTYKILRGNLQSGNLLIQLNGRKLQGSFMLVRMRNGDKKNWLLVKGHDEYATADYRTIPDLTDELKKHLEVKSPPCGG